MLLEGLFNTLTAREKLGSMRLKHGPKPGGAETLSEADKQGKNSSTLLLSVTKLEDIS